MRAILCGMALACVTSISYAKEAFTCEKIKDKAIRLACIKDRAEKDSATQKASIQAQDSILAAEKERAEQAAKKEINDFVNFAKGLLTKSYKDPAGAQFTNLKLIENTITHRKSLCGSVNGKNSYGAYTGVKMFYVVSPIAGSEMEIWTEGQSTSNWKGMDKPDIQQSARKLHDAEMTVRNLYCEQNSLNIISDL